MPRGKAAAARGRIRRHGLARRAGALAHLFHLARAGARELAVDERDEFRAA